MAEQRIVPLFVMAVTLLGTFIGLAVTMPQDLLAAGTSPEYSQYSVPEEFSAADLTKLAWLDNDIIGSTNLANPDSVTMGGGNPVQFMLPPDNPKIEVWGFWGSTWPFSGPSSPKTLYFVHVWMWLFFVNYHPIEGLDNVGYGFDKTEIVDHWDASQNCSEIEATCSCGKTYYIFIGYNSSKYSSIGDAVDNADVIIVIGVGIVDAMAGVDAWNVVGALLTFQIPQINPVLNFFICLPFYAGIAIMIYLLVVMIIPFAGG